MQTVPAANDTSAAERFDLISMGRIGVDLYPEQWDVELAAVETFARSLGGSATNVAVAAARLGARAAVVTKVGDDAFGTYIRRALAAFDVDARWVGTHPELRTPLAFCEVHPPDSFPLLFYREPTAPDLTIAPDELDLEAIRRARVLWTTGSGLSVEPSRSATLAALRARDDAADDAITILDLDYRPTFWSHESDARRWAREAIAHATVVVGNQDEAAVAVGTRDPVTASAELLGLGPELAIVKRGPHGVLARSATAVIELDPVRLEIVNGLGAGDAFGGALVYALVAGWETECALKLANAAGALVASRLACADDMPTLDELWPLVAEGAPS